MTGAASLRIAPDRSGSRRDSGGAGPAASRRSSGDVVRARRSSARGCRACSRRRSPATCPCGGTGRVDRSKGRSVGEEIDVLRLLWRRTGPGGTLGVVVVDGLALRPRRHDADGADALALDGGVRLAACERDGSPKQRQGGRGCAPGTLLRKSSMSSGSEPARTRRRRRFRARGREDQRNGESGRHPRRAWLRGRRQARPGHTVAVRVVCQPKPSTAARRREAAAPRASATARTTNARARATRSTGTSTWPSWSSPPRRRARPDHERAPRAQAPPPQKCTSRVLT